MRNFLRAMILLLLFSCSSSTSDTGNQSAVITFVKEYGGLQSDAGESVIIANDGSYMVAGYTESKGSGLADAWLLSIDKNGNLLWDKTYGEAEKDYARSIKQSSDGGFIIGGWTESYGVDGTGQYMIKTQSDGTEDWANTYDNIYNGRIETVIQGSDDSYIFVGYNEYSSEQQSSFIVSRVDAAGIRAWTYISAEIFDDYSTDLIETTDHHIVAVGTKGVDSTSTDIFIVKLELVPFITVDNLKFAKSFDYETKDYAEAVIQTSDGNYLVSGTSDNGLTIDYYLLLINPQGDQIWRKTYPTGFFGDVFDLIETEDRGFLIAGFVFSTESITSDAFLLKTTSNGTEQWFKTYGEAGDAYCYSVVQTEDGGFLGVGAIDYNNAEKPNLWMFKTDAKGNL